MKRLSVIAFLAALGLLAAGCGGGGGGGSSSVASSGTTNTVTDNTVNDETTTHTVETNSAGFTTETKFIDPQTGEVVARISELSASATGSTPPRAPSYARTSGTAESVSID
jgi:hypothetical protein